MTGFIANWLWQGCAVAFTTAMVLRVSRRMSATTRYHIWWLAMAIVLVLPVTSFQLPASGSQQAALGSQLPASSFQEKMLVQEGLTELKPAAGSVVIPPLPAWTGALLVFVWCAWAATSLARTAAALVTLGRTKRSLRPFPATREVRLPTWLSLRARSRPARLAVSDHVRAAAVLGLTSPSIVVAPVALEALSDEELDQIVAHEWAHVHRRDDIARLVQRVIVAFAGLHPAVWWIDRQLQLERETACDDWAVNATGSARSLAVSLTKLASLPGRPSDTVLVPAALASSELTRRVVRLLDRRRNTSTVRRVGAPMVVAPMLGALALAAASVEIVVTSPLAPTVSHAARTAGTASASLADGPAPAPPEPLVVPSAAARHLVLGDGVRRPRKIEVAARESTVSQTRRAAPAAAPESVTAGARSPRDDEQSSVVADRTVAERQPGTENLPGITTAVGEIIAAPALPIAAAAGAADKGPTLWGAAADAGVLVGKGSQKAAVATAGFFTRMGKSIAGGF